MMEALNTSQITNFSASVESTESFVSYHGPENELFLDTDAWEINQGDLLATTGNPKESIIFDMPSLPTDPNISQSSSTLSSFEPPPEVVEIKSRRSRHRRSKYESHPQRSSPYAQLCFDPNRKTLVTMLEIDIINGRNDRRHSRLPLDAPSLEDYFPWLHNSNHSKVEDESIPGLPSSSWSVSCGDTTVSDMTMTKDNTTPDDLPHGYGEPIILSGWMMDADAMSDEEADIYWLLNDGKDVWVQIDKGCAKAFRKMFSCCGTWRLKRSAPSSSQQECAPDARGEAHLRYSVLPH